jgi:hypothetical protein
MIKNNNKITMPFLRKIMLRVLFVSRELAREYMYAHVNSLILPKAKNLGRAECIDIQNLDY